MRKLLLVAMVVMVVTGVVAMVINIVGRWIQIRDARDIKRDSTSIESSVSISAITPTATTAAEIVDQLINLTKQAKDLALKHKPTYPSERKNLLLKTDPAFSRVLKQMDELLVRLNPLVASDPAQNTLVLQTKIALTQAMLVDLDDARLIDLLALVEAYLGQLKSLISSK